MVQLSLSFMRNSNLFSNHYLTNFVQQNPEWEENEKAEQIFEKVKQIYLGRKETLSSLNEAQLEKYFIIPVLETLGHYVGVQATVEKSAKCPDYGFFRSKDDMDEALKNQGKDDFYAGAIAVGDAKKWNVSLDKKQKGPGSFEYPNPSLQIHIYLMETPPKWAILTNGHKWRIYYQPTRLDTYYEIDLINLLETEDVENFKYFYLFFRLEAFIPGADGKNFLDRIYECSITYARELGESLQENVYKAMKILAEGFLSHPENNLTKTEADINLIHENTLKLLYRLLFIFYAESRDLLNLKNPSYNVLSLFTIKREIARKIDKKELILPITTDYWSRLDGLSKMINNGTEFFNIPKEELYIPPYNGGLFNPERNPFLREKKIGDSFIAQSIDLLARSEGKNGGGKGFVDYSTLGIRHLGSIYERLLEYKLRIAEEELVAVKVKGKETWIPKDKAGSKTVDEAKPGNLYLATDRGERKATGSYYTPNYIVKYIVENTLGPLVEEKVKKVNENGGNLVDEILSIKVLDPAMGSGHFLVEAIDFLARALVEALGESPHGEYDEEIKWARREVVRHCIYGVDLNPMAVELAKLSLWLSTVAVDKPLTFLDHRLKCGNSLIGANLIDLSWHPDAKEKKKRKREEKAKLDERQIKFKEEVHKPFVDKIVNQIDALVEISDDTLEDVKHKEELFNELRETKEYRQIKAIADIYTAVYFSDGDGTEKVPEKRYYNIFWAMKGDEAEWRQKTNYKWFRDAMKIADGKHFFHWELEFPEVFFEAGKEKENPGFDAVVGNPPWGATFDKQDKPYLSELFESYFGDIDSCNLFTEIGIKLIADKKGWIGFITPNTWLYTAQNANARKFVLMNSTPLEIIELEKNIFKDVPDIVPIVFSFIKECRDEKCRIKLLKIKHRPNDLFLDSNFRATYDVKVKLWRETEGFVINTRLAPKTVSTLEKIRSNSIIASEVCDVLYGIKTGDNIKFLSRRSGSGYVPALVHAFEVKRYSLDWAGDYLYYTPELEGYRIHKVDVPKIIVQYTRKISMPIRIMATFDYEGLFYPLNTFSYITERQESGYNLMYLMAVFSSSTLNFYHANTFIDYGIKPTYLQKHPIRRIAFTTPPEERITLVASLKSKYNANQFDEILQIVDSCLPKDADDNFITEKEKSDVVHDLLAFLAERMIEMNKEKQAEIKGFLGWLERETGAPIDDLKLKTTIKAYYGHDFDALLDVLKKNKKIIKPDPTRREFQEKVQQEYNTSISKLKPLLTQIGATDRLIDQIVYKLYGLMEEEIEVVGENI